MSITLIESRINLKSKHSSFSFILYIPPILATIMAVILQSGNSGQVKTKMHWPTLCVSVFKLFPALLGTHPAAILERGDCKKWSDVKSTETWRYLGLIIYFECTTITFRHTNSYLLYSTLNEQSWKKKVDHILPSYALPICCHHSSQNNNSICFFTLRGKHLLSITGTVELAILWKIFFSLSVD